MDANCFKTLLRLTRLDKDAFNERSQNRVDQLDNAAVTPNDIFNGLLGNVNVSFNTSKKKMSHCRCNISLWHYAKKWKIH